MCTVNQGLQMPSQHLISTCGFAFFIALILFANYFLELNERIFWKVEFSQILKCDFFRTLAGICEVLGI